MPAKRTSAAKTQSATKTRSAAKAQSSGPSASSPPASTTPTVRLEPGDRAPAFNLADQEGNKVRLSSLKGRKVLVYFYPKADTPGCTTQSCALRDVQEDIGDTVIVGISPDTPERQKRFDEKYGLGFPLLADVEHTVAEKYGVWGEKKNYGRTYLGIIRSAFLVDEKGKIERAWYKISPKDTPVKLQQALAGS